jgi:hypothetical protein
MRGIFSYAVLELNSSRNVWTRTKANKFARRWDDATKLCKGIANDPMLDSDLRRLAVDITPHLERHAGQLIETGNLVDAGTPYIIGDRRCGKRGNDANRGKTRALAMAARQLFGGYLYQSISIVITVGLALEKPVKKDNIADWCADLSKQAFAVPW